MISYTHIQDPQGPRFQQSEKDPIPGWAIDVRSESISNAEKMTDQKTTKELLAQAKDALYNASCIMSGVIITNDYQQKAYQDVLNAWHAINKHDSKQTLTEEQKTQLELDCGRDRFSGR
jgi:hypothetical protein